MTHVLITGPITGEVTLPDGTKVDVTPGEIVCESVEQAAEVAHQIGQWWAQNGHPADVDVDEKSGERVQRAFEYDDSHHREHCSGKSRRRRTTKEN